jgi:drug/metabolite transporter (DMT)-like permease
MSFAAMGAVSAAIYLAVATALSLAHTSVPPPLQYPEIIGAMPLGLVVFGTSPDATTWLGTLVIVATGFTPFVANDRCRGYCST